MQEYVRSLRTPVSIMTICQAIVNIMGEEKYQAWIDTTPDEDEAFYRAAASKLAELRRETPTWA
jgi:pyruvate/oxaloacetate carboxyltransferase